MRFERQMVSGWLHEPEGEALGRGLVITHGAGSNCDSPLLVAVAGEFASAGFHVLRCNLPYRQERPSGPPIPGLAARDRAGLALAAREMRSITPSFVMLGGHSYGGRQSSMLAADDLSLADALLLLSYPLHPPRKPEQLRTQHFAQLRTPSLFVHGARDPFGTVEEMQRALTLIPAKHKLVPVEKTGHELKPGIAPVILEQALIFV